MIINFSIIFQQMLRQQEQRARASQRTQSADSHASYKTKHPVLPPIRRTNPSAMAKSQTAVSQRYASSTAQPKVHMYALIHVQMYTNINVCTCARTNIFEPPPDHLYGHHCKCCCQLCWSIRIQFWTSSVSDKESILFKMINCFTWLKMLLSVDF